MRIKPGMRFGRLTVISRERISDSGNYYYLCKCDCGNEKSIGGGKLTSGNTKSCGCLNIDVLRERSITHGWYGTKLYGIWRGMINRCENVKQKSYPNYGGNGIRVCDEWHSFPPFQKWAFKSGYHDGLSIDRVNNSGDYEPSNCRWATILQQARNKRNNKIIEYMGLSKPIAEWAQLFNIPYGRLQSRFKRGWAAERAFRDGKVRCERVELLETVER